MTHHESPHHPAEEHDEPRLTGQNPGGYDQGEDYGTMGGPPGGVGEFESAVPRTMGIDYDPYQGGDDFRTSSEPMHRSGPNAEGDLGNVDSEGTQGDQRQG